jgi:hypothetical protein
MEHKNQFKYHLHDSVRTWKAANPEWQIFARTPASPRDPEPIRARRSQLARSAAELFTTGLHRLLIEKCALKPGRGHLESYTESFIIAHAQEKRGIHLPFHQEMERGLSHAIEVVDGHLGHIGSDTAIHIQDWYRVNIEQPVKSGVARAQDRLSGHSLGQGR